MKRSLLVGLVVSGLLSASAFADDPLTGPFDNKGTLTFNHDDFSLNLQIVSELAIREPSMCEGSAQARIDWNKEKNTVRLRAKFDGLPHKPSFCYDDFLGNPGHPINPMPDCVEEGVWQIWLIGRWATVTSTWYYDATTGALLGNEGEFAPGGRFAGTLPADAIAHTVPAFHMVCTPTFESHPNNLKATVDFTFQYDQILDDRGTGGALSTILPTNLNDPNSLDLITTVGGIPASEAMHWDDVLGDLEAGTGAVAIYTTVEPDPKPDFLLSRDNSMIGWASVMPPSMIVPIVPPSECGTYQLDRYFDFIPSP